jgi:uncharacterized protein (DUF1800 family)
MSRSNAVVAAQRFGLGLRPGDLALIGGDPQGWLTAQLVNSPQGPSTLADRPPVSDRIAAIKADRAARKERKQETPPDKTTKPAAISGDGDNLRQLFIADAALRCEAAIISEMPLVERLVHFWSNHFTVSGQRPIVAPLALPFETEAIRPHVLGKFSDLLLAAARHPAMQLYLDNAQSVGPMSRFGAQKAKGLNENLARELLELHTLGVDGGYSQSDVREVAKILTGWTVAGLGKANPGKMNAGMIFGGSSDDTASGFRFAPQAHEPGDKIVLGKTYREDGEAEGRALLLDLAGHPATARHLATKLARHFISDAPEPAIVESLAKTYLESDGDLAVVMRSLISMDAVWQEPARKIRTPNDWVIAMFRALQITGGDTGKRCLVALRQLGQIPFMAPSPAGWPDQAADWLSPEALMTHIDLARVVAKRAVAGKVDPRQLVSEIIGPSISAETAFQIGNAPSKADGLALLLVSPEFMRR